ncbi:MAG: GAF domain-containing protein, partial [Nitrospira sp.]|nr:GAF domain-containing protein [Nitrospira sp.]MCB9709930.1 GAF domain-containing protein [Nitrospiraceae bacterium]MDR4487152.1 GAF domain-containing protein [Nitrospirales bacterium]MCA9468010.1 GAF domain-containing protein [Nitrospira sp.]MCA9476162.1 GAF domain-containing protein [Nitrospira sp.]
MATPRALSLQELKQVVKERNREIQLLHRMSASIGSSLELGTVLKHIVEVVVEVTKADACLLYLISEKKDELILRASKNPHPRLIGRIAIGLGEGITGWVARERLPVVIPRNASDDSRFKFFHRLPEDRYQAFVSVPILSKGEVVGVINVQHKRSKRYGEEKLALLTTIANQVGGAIENARLYDEMRQKARRLETLSQVSETVASSRLLEDVLQLIVTMTAQLMSSKISSIMLVDQDSGELRIAATQSLSEAYRRKPPLKIGQSMSGRAVKEQRPIYVPDVTAEGSYFYRDLAKQEGLHSLLTVPMLMKERIIGVINVYTSTHYVFSDEEVKTLQSIANQAAVAIEHTRLMEKSFEMQEALEVRKLVERAKGFLMASRGLSEPEAFKLLQRQSMNLRKSMREISEAIILAEELQRATQ